MAHYRASLQVSLGCEEAFDYLSDFSRTEEWDPGVVEATRLDRGEVRVGSEFRLSAGFLGRTVALTYEVIECHRPLVITFRGENATVVPRGRAAGPGSKQVAAALGGRPHAEPRNTLPVLETRHPRRYDTPPPDVDISRPRPGQGASWREYTAAAVYWPRYGVEAVGSSYP